MTKLSPVLFIPHGGGPLPILGDIGHTSLIHFLQQLPSQIDKPSAIVIISAHWEENMVTITSHEEPSLLYDYYGFPDEAYDIDYSLKGNALLSDKIQRLLCDKGIESKLDSQRGFDHGVFVPLKIIMPDAQIPCVQISLVNSLDAQAHIAIGEALRELREDNILFIGSGFSFHNLPAFFSNNRSTDSKNEQFQEWLIDVCTNKTLTDQQRRNKLTNWQNTPFASYCHPREEHLIPLHVCAGLSNSNATLIFDDTVLERVLKVANSIKVVQA